MVEFEGLHDAGKEVRRWLFQHEADFPAHLDERLRILAGEPSPVVVIVQFTEAVYANPDEFSDEAKELAAAAAMVAETFSFHGMQQDQRGSKIAKVLTGKQLAKADRPEVAASFQPEPEEPEAPTDEAPADEAPAE